MVLNTCKMFAMLFAEVSGFEIFHHDGICGFSLSERCLMSTVIRMGIFQESGSENSLEKIVMMRL